MVARVERVVYDVEGFVEEVVRQLLHVGDADLAVFVTDHPWMAGWVLECVSRHGWRLERVEDVLEEARRVAARESERSG